MSSFSRTVLLKLSTCALLLSPTAQAEGNSSFAAQLNADAAGSSAIVSDLSSDVEDMIKKEFDQSIPQQRAAVRAALVLQTMGRNEKPSPAELTRHLQLHLTTTYCLKRVTKGSEAVQDSLIKQLREKVLNTAAKQENYKVYQSAAGSVKLKIATDNDCAELDK